MNRKMKAVTVAVAQAFIVIGISLASIASASEASNGEKAEAGYAFTPLEIGIFPPLQLPPSNWDVYGFQIAVPYAKCREGIGCRLGILNQSQGDYYGAQISAFGICGGDYTGIQAALWLNTAKTATGLQLNCAGCGVNYAETMRGIQIAGLGVNWDKEMYGLQMSVVANIVTEDAAGLQIGLFNYCKTLKGVQIGLINIIKENSIPVLPILNAGF